MGDTRTRGCVPGHRWCPLPGRPGPGTGTVPDGDGQGCDDEVEEVIQPTSEAGDSAKSIFLLPERNEDNTGWLIPEGMNPASGLNKMKPEDIATVHKHKEILAKEVAKNYSVVDQ